MTKKFEKAKIEAALKQAAKTAVSGSRVERSGRFLANSVPLKVEKTSSKG